MAQYKYYDVNIYNDSSIDIEGKFNETRVVPILNHPNDYELSIFRFKVPINNVPIMVWENDTKYKITMTWRGSEVSSFLENTVPPNPIYNKPIITNYQDICDIFNNAMQDCFNQLVALYPGPFPPNPDFFLYAGVSPFLVYNDLQRRYELFFPFITENYTDPPTAVKSTGNWGNFPDDINNLIGVFFNENLGNLLKGLLYVVDSTSIDKRYKLSIKRTFNNIIVNPNLVNNFDTFYLLGQQFNSLSSINDLESIIFKTSVPVEYELVGAQTNIVSRILTDFEIVEDDYGSSYIQFFPQGPLRYYQLNMNEELRTFDVQVFWLSKDRTEYPIIISPGDKITIKIQFRKKPPLALSEALEDQNIM